MISFMEDNPKTYSATKAVAKAVKEEAKDKDDFAQLAITAIGCLAMDLAMKEGGNETEFINAGDVRASLAMLECARDAIVDTCIKTGKERDKADALN